MAERVAAAPHLRAYKPSPSPRISFPSFPGGLPGPLPPSFFPGSLGVAMSSAPSLSPSLRQFLEHPGPLSLMLRSAPGPARNRVVRELFASFRGAGFLLSRSRPQDNLAGTDRSDVFIVEQSLPPATLDQAARTRSAWARVVRRGLTDYGEAGFLWLPGALQEVWSRLDDPGQRTLVVLDGWDRWVEEYLGSASPLIPGFPDRAALELDLVRRMGRFPVHLVFLVERNGSEALEFLVNTVVALGDTPQEDHLLRWKSASPHSPRAMPTSGHDHAPRGPELTPPGYGSVRAIVVPH